MSPARAIHPGGCSAPPSAASRWRPCGLCPRPVGRNAPDRRDGRQPHPRAAPAPPANGRVAPASAARPAFAPRRGAMRPWNRRGGFSRADTIVRAERDARRVAAGMAGSMRISVSGDGDRAGRSGTRLGPGVLGTRTSPPPPGDGAAQPPRQIRCSARSWRVAASGLLTGMAWSAGSRSSRAPDNAIPTGLENAPFERYCVNFALNRLKFVLMCTSWRRASGPG